jgi:hypothetical protein
MVVRCHTVLPEVLTDRGQDYCRRRTVNLTRSPAVGQFEIEFNDMLYYFDASRNYNPAPMVLSGVGPVTRQNDPPVEHAPASR